jgi:hypothetical protein
MNRFFMMMLAFAALGLTFGPGCKKDEAKGGDEAAKPAEGDTAATPDEPAKDEAAAAEGEEGEEAAAAEGEEGEAAAGDTVTTGIKECDELIAIYSKCDKMPQASRDAFMTGAKAWQQAAESGDDATKAAIATGCTQATEASKEAMAAMGCE